MSPRRQAGEQGRRSIGVVVCLLLVGASAIQVVSGHVLAIDRAVATWCAAHQVPRVFAAFDMITRLAAWQRVCGALIVVAAGIALVRATLRPVLQALLAIALLAAVTRILKAVFVRPGPTGVAPPAYDGAWPSGHMVTIVVATVVILGLIPVWRAAHPRAAPLVFMPAVLLGAALVYCGDHWFTDVAVAVPLGLLIGWAALWMEEWGRRRIRSRQDDSRRGRLELPPP